MTRLPLVVLAVLAGCEKEDPVAYIQEDVRVQVMLDDTTPSRTWNIHVETNDAAMRDGPTWTTVEVGVMLTAAPVDPWPVQWVDAELTGDEPAEESVYFGAPAQQAAHLTERYQADCVAGEPCAWDYELVLERREGGESEFVADFTAAALVTLGTESVAPEGATLSIEAIELGLEE